MQDRPRAIPDRPRLPLPTSPRPSSPAWHSSVLRPAGECLRRTWKEVPGGDRILTWSDSSVSLVHRTYSPHSRAVLLVVMMWHAPFIPLSLEYHQGPSSRSVAEPLSAVAQRDLLRRQDDADRLP